MTERCTEGKKAKSPEKIKNERKRKLLFLRRVRRAIKKMIYLKDANGSYFLSRAEKALGVLGYNWWVRYDEKKKKNIYKKPTKKMIETSIFETFSSYHKYLIRNEGVPLKELLEWDETSGGIGFKVDFVKSECGCAQFGPLSFHIQVYVIHTAGLHGGFVNA